MRLCDPVRDVVRGAIFLAVSACLALDGFAAEGAQWIWSPDHGRNEVPESTCHFRKTLTLPSVREGTVLISADDRYELFINGRRVGSGESVRTRDQFDVSRFLTRGRNLIAVRVTNTDGTTAALAVRIEVEDLTGRKHVDATDGTWVTSLKPLPFWYTPLYNDNRWDAAQSFGPLGSTAPWDDVAPTLATGGSPGMAAENVDDRASAASVSDGGMYIADTPIEVQEDGPFRVGPQFEVESLLGNDRTGSLIALTFNEFGHIIASREGGELLLIHDSDGDQKPDSVRIYSDLVKDCHGILCLNGFVFVTGEGPDGRGLYRLRDSDRDGRLEEVRTLVKFASDDSEYGPHGLTLGSDGYLYVVAGSHAGVPENVEDSSPYRDYYEGDIVSPRQEDPDQQHAGIRAPGGTILRLDVNAEHIQLLAGGLRNAYDLAFNREGELFTRDSDMEADLGTPWYQSTPLLHVLAGAEFGWRSGWAKWPEYYVDQVPAILDTGRGAPTGMAFYRHYIFPEEYHDAMFVADWANGEIAVVRLKPNGATYSANSEVFLEGDSLSVSDLEIGPDGYVYFVTGGRGTVGGLYRVKSKGMPPKGATELGTGLNAAIRQPQLDSAWSRQKIAAIKTEMGPEWDRLLPGVALSTANPWQYRVRALDLMQLYGPAPTAEIWFSNFNTIGKMSMTTERFESRNMEDSGEIALDGVQAGSGVQIVRIDSGHRLNNRLAAMGLLKNTEIKVVRNDGAGQIIVNVKNSKV
ncbi:MAG: FeoA domain-containing protein, partial [Planctomycetes bacterium]|nr:FeoA domain-containing protein [Planctomycetota bacterium]